MLQGNFSLAWQATGVENLLAPVKFSVAWAIRYPLISNPVHSC
jgi:hypothetical protein